MVVRPHVLRDRSAAALPLECIRSGVDWAQVGESDGDVIEVVPEVARERRSPAQRVNRRSSPLSCCSHFLSADWACEYGPSSVGG